MKDEIKYLLECASQNILDKRKVAKIISIMSNSSKNEKKDDIAIVGISAKMPRAENKEEFWELIINSTDCVTDFPKERKELGKKYLKAIGKNEDVDFVKAAYLDEIDEFDYSFFGITPNEAKLMDPNQRLFLQEAWNCLDDAGYGDKKLSGKNIGLFVGYDNSTVNEYRQMISDISPESLTLSIAGNLVPAIASRISHILDFHGPAMVVDTACSSALLAIHLACMCIQNKQCESAVVGSVKLSMLPILIGEKLGVEANDWRTKAFDDSADGTGVGEGVGAIFIKPLKQAIKDGDDIYAVIKGGMSNHDGNSIGLTAPNTLAQEKVILDAWKNAGVKGSEISYIEAHGTGTKIGDPIEIQGLTKAFSKYTDEKQFCAIGSVKTNIGHLDHASGIASIIKVAMALKNKKLPPTRNFKTPNRIINFINSPFYVNTQLKDWESENGPLRCGISSFGLSGTNVHLVLEEAPKKEKINNDYLNILTLSAKSKRSLKKYIEDIKLFIDETEESFSDVCYTLNACRGDYEYRIALVAENCKEAYEKLSLLEESNDEIELANNNIYYGNKDKSKNVIVNLDEFSDSKIKNRDKLIEAAKKYCSGVDICWDNLYKNFNKVHLPLYPFDKKKCCIEINDIKANLIKNISNKEAIRINGDYSSVSNEVAYIVANIWGKVLGIEEVNVTDNLFALGGDSIYAIKIIELLKKSISEEVSIKDVMGSNDFLSLVKIMNQKYNTKKLANKLKITKHNSIDEYRVTPQQERLFFINLFDNNSIAYNMPNALVVEGDIDIIKLENAFKELIDSQESLRTAFYEKEGKVFAKIHNNIDFQLEVLESNEENSNKLIEDFIKPFDLTKAPLLRARIVKVSHNKYFLLFDIHHIICDGISTTILIKELINNYIGDVKNPNELNYSDYALWFNEEKELGNYNKQIEFWKNNLKGDLSRLELSRDKKRPKRQSFEGNTISKDIDIDLNNKIKNFAKEHSITINTLLLTALNIMLKKYSNQDDIIVGSPVSGREDFKLDNIIGLFVNTVAMRNKVDDNYTIEELIQNINQNAINVYENQQLPFDEVIGLINPQKDLSRNPIFDVMFSMQNFEQASIELNNMKISAFEFEKKVSKVDITVNVIEKNNTFNVEFEYCTAIFKKSTINRMMDNLINILEAMINNSNVTVGNLQMLTDDQINELKEIGSCYREYDSSLTIDKIIEKQVYKTPNKIALTINGEDITYKNLNEKANELANTLLLRGIKKSDVVAIMAERSKEMFIALLATVKIGATYVPIDPTYPKDRIDYIIKDSGVKNVLYYCKNTNIETNFEQAIDLSEEISYSGNKTLENINFDSNTSMYMIYTSGSTGLPKGVILTHKNVNNFINGITDIININENNKILSVTTFGFDIFVLESFLMLSKGASIVLASDEQINDIEKLSEIIDRENIDTLQITPLRMRLLLSSINSKIDLKKLRLLMIGGEAFPLDLLSDLKGYKNLRIYNMYGPTETAIWSTVKELTGLDYITVGKPIANTSCYIVDKQNNLLPIGSVGELIIGGHGVSKGYHNREELNNERFVSVPSFGLGRMYKTGDIARWTIDGEIEILGRNDSMVKINGYRVELGEIQNCLEEHEGIKEVCVVNNSEDYITAYYTENFKVDSKELREFLLTKLPNYMIPNKFISLGKLPHTPNGKFDLKYLKNINVNQEKVQKKALILPTNKLQKLMYDSWKRILEAEEISLDDNFFEIGGNSMKAIMFISEMKKHNVELVINNVFSYSTILDLEYYLNFIRKDDLLTSKKDIELGILSSLKISTNIEEIQIDDLKYIVYCIEEFNNENKISILNYVNKKVSKSLYPHYIISKGTLEEIQNNNDKNNLNMFEEKMNMIDTESDLVLQKINEMQKAFESNILNGEVEKEYRLAPIQQFFLDSERYSGTLLYFDQILDINIFNQTIKTLLLNQGIFRSTLVKRNNLLFWSQHELQENIEIPYVDISNLKKESKIDLLKNISEKYYFKAYDQIKYVLEGTLEETYNNSLLYRMLLLKVTERDYYLFLPVNHSIFDAMSGEIVKSNISEYYNRILNGEVIGLENNKQYVDFVDQVRKGPVNITDKELMEEIEVLEYSKYTELLNEKIIKYNSDKSTYVKFEFEFGNDEELSDDNAWQVAFEVFNSFIQEYIGINALPIMIYYYGRNYEEKGYFNTIGEFIDMIPVFIRGNLTSDEMVEKTQEAIAFSEKHNINFSNLSLNKSQQLRTPEICDFVNERNEKVSMVFNFQGKFEEKEMNLFEEILYERLMHELNMEQSVNIHFMTRYTNNKIQVDINIPFDTQDGTIKDFFENKIKNIKGYKEIKYDK